MVDRINGRLAVRTSNLTIAEAGLEVIVPTGKIFTVKEIGLSLVTGTATTFGIGVAAAQGITPTSPVALLNSRIGDAALTTAIALAWGTKPTIPAAFRYRIAFAAAIGEQRIINIPEGWELDQLTSLVLWNITTAQLSDFWVAGEERAK